MGGREGGIARAKRKRKWQRKREKGGEKEKERERTSAPPSPSIYFFRSRLRRGTCREGKRLSPRAKAKHRKSLKRASAGVPRTVVRFRVARLVNSYARAPFSFGDQHSRSKERITLLLSTCIAWIF